jgi:Lon protease-like protein
MESQDLSAIPLFPLPNVVLMPAGVLPLHVFEARYCKLVEDVLAGNHMLAIPQLAPGWEPFYHGEPQVHTVFGLGRILEHEVLDGDRYNILVEGIARVQLLEETLTFDGYRSAVVSLLVDEMGDAPSTEKAIRKVKLALGQLVSLHPQVRQLSTLLDIRIAPLALADTVVHALMINPQDRQSYIECDKALERIHRAQATVERVLTEIMSQ